jgi:hypothetical protein
MLTALTLSFKEGSRRFVFKRFASLSPGITFRKRRSRGQLFGSFATFDEIFPSPSEDGLPAGTPLVGALDQTLNVAGDPAAIEIARRRLSTLIVDITFPGTDEESKQALDGLVLLGRLVVRPDAVADGLGRRDGAHDGIVRGSAIELGEGRARSCAERQLDPARRDVVNCSRGRESQSANRVPGNTP